MLYEAITFSAMGKYKNLSRADPATVSTGVGSQSYFHGVGGGPPIIFTSTIIVSDCNLLEGKMTNNNKLQKSVEGACFAGEWERLVGAIGQVIRLRQFKGQIAGGDLTFGTAYAPVNFGKFPLWNIHVGYCLKPHQVSHLLRLDVQEIVSAGRIHSHVVQMQMAPCFPVMTSVSYRIFLFSRMLTYPKVPVYDARKIEDGFLESLSQLDKLKRIETEIPKDSCAVVAYTLNTWGRDEISVSFNVRWVMLLGVPGGKR